MEPAAREINLTDLIGRMEKIIGEAFHIAQRLDDAVDTLRGSRPKDAANSAANAEPSGLVPQLAAQLSRLETVQHDQRMALNRLSEGLREAPPPTALNSITADHTHAQRAYR